MKLLGKVDTPPAFEFSITFNESCTVWKAPRFLQPLVFGLIVKLGPQKIITISRFLLGWMYKKGDGQGLVVLGRDCCVLSADRRYCLFVKAEWNCCILYKAITDLQREGWFGLVIPTSKEELK